MGMFTYFWMYLNIKVNIQYISNIKKSVNQINPDILRSSSKGECPSIHHKLHIVTSLSNSWLVCEYGHSDQYHM